MHLRPFPLAAAGIALGLGVVLTPPQKTLSAAETPPIVASDTTGAALLPSAAESVHELADTRGSAAARTRAALSTLAKHVSRQSHPDALRRAFDAYYTFKAAHPEQVRKPYLYFVDYGLDSRTRRGYIFDMESLRVIDGPFTVAHGRGSAPGAQGVPTRFSNKKDSAMSSLGLYLAQELYAFSGKSGGRRYHSTGLRLRGLSGRFNSAARARGVVVHGAPYVTPARAGRSEGCPAMEESRARKLLPRISNGGLVYLFSPRDQAWIRDDPWS
ncbi:MAG TPA: murein L,D-transpeptidase catalytic domain family protein [Longimicrobiaceae bacterium]|nr:murein L,D-transpeptidase catalytic domain family protein [Longimicrobiaceae bacterium]